MGQPLVSGDQDGIQQLGEGYIRTPCWPQSSAVTGCPCQPTSPRRRISPLWPLRLLASVWMGVSVTTVRPHFFRGPRRRASAPA
jgi:hypothetical protein